jgi:S-phase kinase-associated protein 1
LFNIGWANISFALLATRYGRGFAIPAIACLFLPVDLSVDVDDTASTILPVPGINSETLVAIAAFCELHIDIRRKALASGPPPTPIKPHGVAQAEIDFFHNLEKSEIFSLIMAGHSLGLRALVESAAAAIATLVRGKSPEELRRYFGIKNDFTPEEERDVHAHSGGYWTDM